jgi:hypothetical protein
MLDAKRRNFMFYPSAGKLTRRATVGTTMRDEKSKDPRTHHAFERGSICEAVLRARAVSARLILGLTGSAAGAKRADNPKHPRWSHAADAPSFLLMTIGDLWRWVAIVKTCCWAPIARPITNFAGRRWIVRGERAAGRPDHPHPRRCAS